MAHIMASILDCDLSRLGEQVAEAEQGGAAGIQVDVMDGHYVPNLTFGPSLVRSLRPVVKGVLEADLMIENPDRFVLDFARAGADRLIIHLESTPHVHRVLSRIREAGVSAGVAISPATPLSALEEAIQYVDVVQIMTVDPGFGGQAFLMSQLEKIARLRRLLAARASSAVIEVDGGINPETVALAASAGATVLVAGSAVFKAGGSVRRNVEKLHNALPLSNSGREMNNRGVNATKPKSPELLVATDSYSFVRLCAVKVADEIQRAIAKRGLCSIALCGGTTPRPVYEALASPDRANGIDWSKVRFFFGDERCVPPDHPESNYRLAWESLLRRIPVDPSAVERMKAEEVDLTKAAEEYAAKLPRRIDIILLGLGEEGHTASLFPKSFALREETRLVVPVEVRKDPKRRLTITPPVIRSARTLIVMASGLGKAAIIARAIDGAFMPDEVPVQLALSGIWILDRDAASMLKEGSDHGLNGQDS